MVSRTYAWAVFLFAGIGFIISLCMLVKEKLISQDVVKKILPWRDSGFSAHAKVRLEAKDKNGLKSLAEYIVRSPVSEGKIILSDDGGKVIRQWRIESCPWQKF